MKIYGSEKILSEAASGVPSFRRMNGYESENDAFFSCLASQRSRKWFTAAWKSYEAGPSHYYTALVGSAGLSPANGRKIYSSDQRSYIRQTTTIRMWDIHTGKPLRIIEEHSEGVKQLALSEDGRILVSSDGKIIKIWGEQ